MWIKLLKSEEKLKVVVDIAKDAILTTRVERELKKAVKKEATRRKITMNDFVETALQRELHRGANKDNLAELCAIRDFVQGTIDSYSDVAPDVEELPDVDYYVSQLYDIQARRGYVQDGLIHRYAKLLGVSYNEFLKAIDGSRVTIVKK